MVDWQGESSRGLGLHRAPLPLVSWLAIMEHPEGFGTDDRAEASTASLQHQALA